MKALKLAIIFLLIAGGVYLVFNLDSIIGERGEERPSYGAKNDIQKECEKIRSEWENTKGWDKDLFENRLRSIKQNNLQKMYSQEGDYGTAIDCLRENSINKVCSAYSDALASSQFKDARLRKCYEDVKELEKMAINSEMEGMKVVSRDSRIKEVEDIHSLYTNINKFVNNNTHKVTPAFDMNTGWKSFETLRSDEIKKAGDFKGNRYYSKLKHIPGFEAGLNENNVKAAVDKHKNNFYNSLSKQIIEAFEPLTPDNDNWKKLSQFSSQYMKEYTSIIGKDGTHGANALVDFQVKYKEKIEN